MQTSHVGRPASTLGAESDMRVRIVNVPNMLCVIRLFGSLGLIYLALAGHPTAFLCLYVLLVVTDWIDGKLAILLRQRTEFGARLDSVADATLYATLLFGFCWLEWEFVRRQAWWILAALGSYALTSGACLLKFHRLPSYHTWAAKAANYLMIVAVICIFAEGAVWPFQFTMGAVILVNLEATAITLALRRWRANVRSIYHARRPATHTGGR